MIFGKDTFTFKAADFYPFKNQAEIDRVRAITREDILAMNGVHPNNPKHSVEIAKNDDFELIYITDILRRIIDSDRYDKKCIMMTTMKVFEGGQINGKKNENHGW